MIEPFVPSESPQDPSRRSSGANSSILSIPDVAHLPEPQRETATARIVSALAAAGITTYFGLPGGPVMPVFDAVLRSPGVTLIESRHETHAVFEAMGYWRATGKVPAVVVTSGPGATNVVTGVVAAHLEGVPMLLICGDVAWAASGGRLLQSLGREGIGFEDMLKNVTRAVVRVALPRSAASQALGALRAATNPLNPGPALLIVPIEHGGAQVEVKQRYVEGVRMAVTSQVNDDIAIEVANMLATAQRPLVVVGAACRRYAGAVQRMIEQLRIPFVTTPQGKGIISEHHRFSLRNFGMASSWWARRYTAPGVDVALALGTDLDDVSVGPTPPIGPGGSLVHVDLDPTVFNRNFPTRLGINGDLNPFVERVRSLALELGISSRSAAQLHAEATQGSPFDCEGFRGDESPTLAPHRVIHDLEAAAGPDATYITDIGEHMLFALHYLTAHGPKSFSIHLGLGSMGSGICSAIGHAIGNPERRVVCICGDGGMQMSGSELLVAAKHKLPIVYAVFNDARYNMVYHGYKQQFENEAAWETPWVDFVGWARSMGMPGARIDRPGQITKELLDTLTAPRLPVVLDIRHDASVRIKGAGRVESLQQMSATPPRSAGSGSASTRSSQARSGPSAAHTKKRTPFPGL
ncbi:thiamine pyrophosphate-binding protein [Sorangium sp. So ce375]|uniref:thiamine pyrophosphate-binding protein n=1 Tax=Sorangium sp. So ce375 TaxID=3133306 RepID=UPI003F5B5779